jgi:molecular chaperone GrpE
VSTTPTESGKDAKAAKGDPGPVPGSPREQVVIKDKRKIDPTGRARGPESGDQTGAPAEASAETSKPAAAPAAETAGRTGPLGPGGATMGQPGTPVAGDATQATAAGTPTAEAKPGPKPGSAPAAEGAVTQVEGEVVGETTNGGGTVTVPSVALGAELEAMRSALDERLRDLQRISAEYANYRKRVERDRGVVAEQAVGMVIAGLLPILDDLDRAREHGDLVGPFAAVAEQLGAALGKFGLTGFGEQGDAFDPMRHEAVAHQTSADVTEPTCVSVMRRGYLLGDRLLRPAMVAVADPE